MLPVAGDFYLWLRERKVRDDGSTGNLDRPDGDGFPLPPASLRISAAGTSDPRWFLDTGAAAAEIVRAYLPGRAKPRLMDFGCGAGRVLRHLAPLDAELYGVDWNRRAVRWCRDQLRFAMFAGALLQLGCRVRGYKHNACVGRGLLDRGSQL